MLADVDKSFFSLLLKLKRRIFLHCVTNIMLVQDFDSCHTSIVVPLVLANSFILTQKCFNCQENIFFCKCVARMGTWTKLDIF